MKNLGSYKGFEAVIEFLKILHILSVSKDKKYLSSEGFISIKNDEKGDRVNKMYDYFLTHFRDPSLRITELAFESSMSASTFGHFLKKSTNKSFTQFVVDLRLGYAIRLRLNSDVSISDNTQHCTKKTSFDDRFLVNCKINILICKQVFLLTIHKYLQVVKV